jgi:hypothetical protein
LRSWKIPSRKLYLVAAADLLGALAGLDGKYKTLPSIRITATPKAEI